MAWHGKRVFSSIRPSCHDDDDAMPTARHGMHQGQLTTSQELLLHFIPSSLSHSLFS